MSETLSAGQPKEPAAQSSSSATQSSEPGSNQVPSVTAPTKEDLVDELNKANPLSRTTPPAIFPDCAAVLLALATRPFAEAEAVEKDTDDLDEIRCHFEGYFSLGDAKGRGVPKIEWVAQGSRSAFERCIGECTTTTCVHLAGDRLSDNRDLTRVYAGDVAWLYFYDRMGIFKILGAVLDDYAYKGQFPIEPSDLLAAVLETMVRQTKGGTASTVKDRDTIYRRVLGWSLENSSDGRSAGVTNAPSGELFHQFIRQASQYFRDRRLAQAIQATLPNTGGASIATRSTLSQTIAQLKRALISYGYGRTPTVTLIGILWIIGGLSVIRELRNTLRVPNTFQNAWEYVSAAYDILVAKTPAVSSDPNRYITHDRCASAAREILLQIEAIDTADPSFVPWLNGIEETVEEYRSAYRALTGVDLGMAETRVEAPLAVGAGA
jgi:hypothetical protein